jgi:hypothetical protein
MGFGEEDAMEAGKRDVDSTLASKRTELLE